MPDDQQTPKSRALEYDPGSSVVHKKAITGPLKPRPPSESSSGLPLLLILAAIIIVGGIAVAVVLLSRGGESSEFAVQETTALGCTVVATDDVNVRDGPGIDYHRAWILEAGDSRLALAKVEEAWYQLANGWVPAENVTLENADLCSQLPRPDSPITFHDDIAQPDDIEALGWREVLSENFATGVNGWAGTSNGARLEEGALVLTTTDGDQPQVYPSRASAPRTLSDAFFTFSMAWNEGSTDSRLVLTFRDSGSRAYQLRVGRAGQLALVLIQDDHLVTLGEVGVLPMDENETQVVGLLSVGPEFSVYVDGERVLTAEDDTLAEGDYSLGLVGGEATVRVSRFEFKVP